MDAIKDYDEIETMTDFPKLPAGGYIVKILDAKDQPKLQYFEVVFDITEGEFKAFFGTDFYKDKEYMHKLFVSYKESAKKSFKSFITSVEESNNVTLKEKVKSGILDGSDLKGKLVGAILGYEEYEADDGKVKTRLKKFANFRSVETIRSGDFKVPELKKLTSKKVETPESFGGFSPITDEECPF